MYILTPFSIYVPVKAYTVLYKFWADIAFLHIRRIYIIYMYKNIQFINGKISLSYFWSF